MPTQPAIPNGIGNEYQPRSVGVLLGWEGNRCSAFTGRVTDSDKSIYERNVLSEGDKPTLLYDGWRPSSLRFKLFLKTD